MQAGSSKPCKRLPRRSVSTDRAEYLGQYARLLVQVRRDTEALQAADRAVALGPTDALTLDTIGCVYSRLGAHDRAAPLFAQRSRSNPITSQMRYNLASSLGLWAGSTMRRRITRS